MVRERPLIKVLGKAILQDCQLRFLVCELGRWGCTASHVDSKDNRSVADGAR